MSYIQGVIKVPAKLSINLNYLKHNVEFFKTKLLKNQELTVMVKADAYGAGIVETTKCLEKEGINHFGVAYLKEAVLLRKNGIKAEIIVFSGLVISEIEQAVHVDAIYSVSDLEMLNLLNEKASEYEKTVKVELAIDTGMTRLGFDKTQMQELIDTLKSLKNIEVHGVYSHMSQVDTSKEFTLTQIKVFDECVDILKTNGINPKYVHICNSVGILKYNSTKYNMVRLGIGAYGYELDSFIGEASSLKGIFKLTAPICNIRNVDVGRQVSYGGTYITNKPTKIAVLQIGYADGLTRTLSNRYSVSINGKEAKIIGRICMDTCMVDVTEIDINIHDEAVIFDYNDGKIESIAQLTDTIVYEIITNIGKRVDRKYLDEE